MAAVVEEVGAPIPDDCHAVSVCLPKWMDVVGYEENDPRVVNVMRAGYPRFRMSNFNRDLHVVLEELHRSELSVVLRLFHSLVVSLGLTESSNELLEVKAWVHRAQSYKCMLLPSHSSALRLFKFMVHPQFVNDNAFKQFDRCLNLSSELQRGAAANPVELVKQVVADVGALNSKVMCFPLLNGVAVVFYPEAYATKAKAYWQHSGEILSSRLAIATANNILQRIEGESEYSPFFYSSVLELSECCVPVDFKIDAVVDVSNARHLLAELCSIEEKKEHSTIQLNPLTAQGILKSRICKIFDSSERPVQGDALKENEYSCLLTPSGMAAIFTAFRLAKAFYYAQVYIRLVDNFPISQFLDDETNPTNYYHHAQTMENLRSHTVNHNAAGCVILDGSNPHGSALSAVGGSPKMVVFGFPYIDTLKIMQRLEWNRGGVHFLPNGNSQDLESLRKILEKSRTTISVFVGNPPSKIEITVSDIAAVFTEFPSNPLLRSPDVDSLAKLAKEYGFLLIVDDTISTCANVDLFRGEDGCADIVCSSLTKLFSGVGNVMAGSIVLQNKLHDHARKAALIRNSSDDNINTQPLLSHLLRCMDIEGDLVGLNEQDAVVLETNSRDFLHRSSMINERAMKLACYLRDHEAIMELYYPGCGKIGGEINEVLIKDNVEAGDKVYERFLKRNEKATGISTGYGCLLSFVLSPDFNTETFLDTLRVNKGPSLGTNFTLVCPYTMLAHYSELEWAASCGVSSKLIRVSVGLEPIEELLHIFEDALQASKISQQNKI